jgi:hypothetical protein
MLAVLVVALPFGVESARRRRELCLSRAEHYSEREQYHRRLADEEAPASRQIADENLRLADWCARAVQTFRRAAYRPWESVPTDPPWPLSPERVIDLGDD